MRRSIVLRDDIDQIIFDFDGVIADTENCRYEAFKQVVSPFGKEVETRFLDYHKHNGGKSRFHKFQNLFENILREPADQNKIQELCDNYSQIVVKTYNSTMVFPEVIQFINNSLNQYRMSVVSACETTELLGLLNKIGLMSRFDFVCGSPPEKTDLLAKLQAQGLITEKALYVGDTLNDWEACVANAIAFSAYNMKPTQLGRLPCGLHLTNLNGLLEI